MKFNTLLSALAVICSCVCCVNASGTVEICFANDVNNKLGYSATYRNGMKSCSDGSDDISSLAGTINSIAGSYLSVGSSDVECFNCDMGSYSVGSNNGDFRDLVVLNDVKCNEGLKEVLFRGDKKNPTSIQMNFNNATDMKLPMVDCKNIGLLKFKINNDNSGNDVGYMAGLTVDAPVGLCYNEPIRVNGKKVNSASENLNVLCSIANRGTNQFKSPNGTKYKFGAGSNYNIPGITDSFVNKDLYIEDIEAIKDKPVGQHIVCVDFNDKQSLQKLLSMKEPGLFVIDGKKPHDIMDRVNKSPVVKEFWNNLFMKNDKVTSALNDFRTSNYKTQFFILKMSSYE